MITLQVHLNGEILTVAGTDELGVLQAMVTAVGQLGPDAASKNDGSRKQDLRVSVSGLTSRCDATADEHLRWVQERELQVGDQVLITILETEAAQPPTSSQPARDPVDERRRFEAAKEIYFRLRDRYNK